MKKARKPKNTQINKFFLACECKPGGEIWKVIEPFAYDVNPAFIYGSLGVISYTPECYSIIDMNEKSNPLMGYLMTITHEDTIALLDKIKGYYGEGAFNYHKKTHIRAHTDAKNSYKAWCYVLSTQVLDSYRQIEQIEFGLWDSDQKQIDLLEQISEII